MLSDKAIEKKEDDKLWMFERAQKFFKVIYNNWSVDNQVFWLIAEWWAGKSSFLNFLKWAEIHYSENDWNVDNYESIIFINFNPWYYEWQKELLEKLFDEIIAALKNKGYYTVDISRKFSKFAQSLEDNSQSFFGMKIPFSWIFFWESSLQEHKNLINNFLSQIDKKLVIIIDDLDRVTSDKFIEVLKIVDLTKDFYNTSFILCYDPQNFNSVDTTLIHTQRTRDENIEIDSQKIDNSEMTRYMGKIITSYFPLETDLKILKNQFVEIFTSHSNRIYFTNQSINWINNWIEKLFEYSTYEKWWKYYSDLRSIKRMFNVLVIQSITWGIKWNWFIESLFDNEENASWIYFDLFVKILILKLYHFNIYKKIKEESDIIKNFLYKHDDYLVFLWQSSQKHENEKYSNFLNRIWLEEKHLFSDIFPVFKSENTFDKELKRKQSIRFFGKLQEYISILETASDASYNREIIDAANWVYHAKISLFQRIYKKYGIEWIYKILNRIPLELINIEDSTDKIKRTQSIVNYIISQSFIYKFYDNDFSFYLDIAKILNDSVRSNVESDVSHISDFVYWNENEKALPIKIFENWKSFWEEETIKGLQEWLRLLLSADKSDWWSFYNFDRAVKTDILYKIIYPYFEESYIQSGINFIEYIYQFEQKFNKKILGHLLYMLLHFAPDDKKKYLTEYFVEWFKLKQEYFFNWIIRYVDDFRGDKPIIRHSEIIAYFHREIFENYIKENDELFKDWISKRKNESITFPSKYMWHEDLTFLYWEIFELYQRWKNY